MEAASAGPSTPMDTSEQPEQQQATDSTAPAPPAEPEKTPTPEPVLLSKRKGVDLVLESNDDWKIQEIGFDGVERYLKPETFTDHVGKLARKVEWTKLVGASSPYENAKVEPEDDEDERVAQVGAHGVNVELIAPEAGPWSSVAKYLYESLSQLNILIDDMNVMKNTDYMKALTVLDPILVQEPTAEHIATQRGTQWIWKRRALQEAVQVLETAQKQRQRATSNFGLSADYISYLQRTKFFEELREMRETWRVRKTGDYIHGDLSYRIFGWKYDTAHVFDISRRSLCSKFETSNLSIIEVSVPKDLARRSMLSVSIVKDEVESGDLFRDPNDPKYKYSYKDVDAEKIKLLHWKDSLRWAQNTLILREAFNTLCKEAVLLRNKLSVIRDNVLLIRLYDDWLLRVELQRFPFEKGELPEEGDIYLNRALREMIIGFECTKFIRPQFFCSMPVTHLPETLDLRGCRAYDIKEIEDRAVKPRSLLERLLDVASHRSLVNMMTDVAQRVCGPHLDPTVSYKWLHCGRQSSRMQFLITSKDHEQFMGTVRNVFFAQVSHEGVTIESKEGVHIKCDRDPARVLYACQYIVCCYSVSVISLISRNQWMTPFQVMYANVHALDKDGAPAPHIALCNQAATRTILFVFHVGADPQIFVRRFVVNDKTMKPEEHEWKKLCYKRLHGNTLCKKTDALLSFLRDC